MRMTYSDIISFAQDGAGTTDATIKTFLKRRINERYELITDKLNTWTQVLTRTATSGTAAGASQQYYYNPPNLREIESITVTLDDVDYPLTPVYAQEEWDRLNAETISGNFPARYFRRATDYGIWPYDFEDDGTITINYTQRAIPLYFEDYTTGTAAVTENDQTVTLTTGVTTTLKAGFWFSLAESTEPRGSWYKLGSITDSANFELETYYEETTESGASYIIGQTPEIPEEGHKLLAIGAIADFYLLKQKDTETGTRFENIFWTGAPNITPLQAEGKKNLGGLLGLIETYKDRDDSVIVNRSPVVREPLEFAIPRTATLS